MSGTSTTIVTREEIVDEAQLQQFDRAHIHVNADDIAAWPTANTSTSPEMMKMEIQKGERDTSRLKK